jgi:hypothetical protein
MRQRRDDGNTLLTLQQAAARLRMPPDQVRDLIMSGRLQPAGVRPLRLRARDVDAAGAETPPPARIRPLRSRARELRCIACSRTLAYATPAEGRLRLSPPRGSNAVLLIQTEAGLRCKRCGGRPYLDDSDAGPLAS